MEFMKVISTTFFLTKFMKDRCSLLKKIVLSHEPICVSAGVTGESVAFNIHGHDHSGKLCDDVYHLNCAANVVGYKPISLDKIIKDGMVSARHVKSIHRCIIDNATEKN